MKLEYRTRDEDYISFYEFNATKTPQGKRSMLIQKLAVPVILLLILLCTLVFNVSIIFIIIQVVLYAAFSVIWFIIQNRMIRRNAESVLAKLKKKDRTPYCPMGTLVFGEKEITDQRFGKTNTLYYSDIECIYENGGALYIYMKAGRRLILLAASVLEENDNKVKVLEVLKEKVAPEKFFIS